MLTVESLVGYESIGTQKLAMWRCRCDCGNTCVVQGRLLNSGRRRSCGCKRTKDEDLAGQRFGKLTVLGLDPENRTTMRKVICRCDCGNERSMDYRRLKRGLATSCGCDRRTAAPEAVLQEWGDQEQAEEICEHFRRGELYKLRTLEDWVVVWILEVLPNVVKDTTRIMYLKIMERHILPRLGKLELGEVTAEVIHDWVELLGRTPVTGSMAGIMSEGTVRNTLSVLSGCMRDAQKYGLLIHNPCPDTAWQLSSENVSETGKWLNGADLKKLKPLLWQCRDEEGYPLGAAYELILYAGLTLSEASALQWKDVDLQKGEISVRRFTLEHGTSEQDYQVSVKTASGRRERTVPIPRILTEHLEKIQREYGGEGEDYVVRTSEPGPVNTGRLRVLLYRRSEKAGLGRVTPRLLRDTYAMHAIHAGGTSDVVAELMGFASAQQVTKRYVSGSPRGKRELIERMYKEDMGT